MFLFIKQEEKKYFDYNSFIKDKEEEIVSILGKINFNIDDESILTIKGIGIKKRGYNFMKHIINNGLINEKLNFNLITKSFLQTKNYDFLDKNCMFVLEGIIGKEQISYIIDSLKKINFINQLFLLIELQIKIKEILTNTRINEIYIAYISDLIKYYKEEKYINLDINSNKLELDKFKIYILENIGFNIPLENLSRFNININKQIIKSELILNYENEFDGINSILEYLNEEDKKDLDLYYIVKSDSVSYKILGLIPNLDNYITNINNFIININKLGLFKENYNWYKNIEIVNYLLENINFCGDFVLFFRNTLEKNGDGLYYNYLKNIKFITYITDKTECEIINILSYKNSLKFLTKNYYQNEIQNLLGLLSTLKILFCQNKVLKFLIEYEEYFKNKYNNIQKVGINKLSKEELLYIIGKSINENLVLKEVNISLDKNYPHLKGLLPYQIDGYKKAKNGLNEYNGYIIADDVGLGKTFVGVGVIGDYIIELPKNKKILLISTKSVIDGKAWFYALKSSGFEEKIIEEKIIFTTNIGFDKYVDDNDLGLVVIDEAHFFRNKGTGRFEEISKLNKYEIKDNHIIYKRKVPVFMLTATPINNSMEDLYNLVSIFHPEITIGYNKKILEDKYFIEKLKLFINKYNRQKIVATFPTITINGAEIKDEQPIIKYVQTNEEGIYKENLINFINETFTYGFKENIDNIFSITDKEMEKSFSSSSILKVIGIDGFESIKLKLEKSINIPINSIQKIDNYEKLLIHTLSYIEKKFQGIISKSSFSTYLYLNNKKDETIIKENNFIYSKINKIEEIINNYLLFINEEFIEKPKNFINNEILFIEEWKEILKNTDNEGIIDYIKNQNFTYDFISNYNETGKFLNGLDLINYYNNLIENFIIEKNILNDNLTKTQISKIVDDIYDFKNLKKEFNLLLNFKEKGKKEQTQKGIFNGFLGALVLKRFDSSPYSLMQTLKKIAYKNDNLDLEEDNTEEVKESINSLTQNDRDYIKSIIDKYENIILERDFKYERLKELILKEKDKQWLIFTSYTDTLLDLEIKIKKDFGLELNIETIKGSDNSKTRLNIIRRFAPGVNNYIMNQDDRKIDILIATDSIAEGVNLHDVYRGMNYDLPYNPVKLQQRVGRLFRVGAKHTPVFYNFVPSTLMDNMLGLMKIIGKKENIIKTFFGEKKQNEDIEKFLNDKVNSNNIDYKEVIEDNKKTDIFISEDNNYSEFQELKIKELIIKYGLNNFTFGNKKILYNSSFWVGLNKTFIIPILNGKIYNNIAIEFKGEEKERIFNLIGDNFINYLKDVKSGDTIKEISIILKILFSNKIDNLINDNEIKELSSNSNIVNNFIPKQKYELIFKQLIDINKPLNNDLKELYYLVIVL